MDDWIQMKSSAQQSQLQPKLFEISFLKVISPEKAFKLSYHA